ncbi:MAG: NAD-binding protein [Streptosporangiales bacterium]|nr:NAD-binding protein [Streptosporangiales bacterium]
MEVVMSDSPRAGFIGLGNIGAPMAATLVRAGFEVRVYDVRPGAVAAAEREGAVATDGPAAVAAGCDLIGLAVLDDTQVTEVTREIAAAARPETVVIVHSTVLPRTVTALQDSGVRVVDAPVSGGDMGAAAGTLTVMAGGEPEALARCEAYFAAIGERVELLGPPGAGAAAKLSLQLMTYANHLVALEAVTLAAAHDIAEDRLIDLATATTGDSWTVRNWGFFDRLLRDHRDAGTEAAYRYFGKDLFDVVLVAREAGVSLPLAGLASQALAPAFRERYRDLTDR